MSDSPLERLLFEAFPDDFWRRMLKAVFIARSQAWFDLVDKYQPAEFENVRWAVARVNVEGLMRDVAEMFDGIEATVEKASSWNHTELKSNNIVVTQHSVATPCAPIEMSNYVQDLAQFNTPLFAGYGAPEAPEDAPLLAYLLHGQSRYDLSNEKGRTDRQKYGHLAGSAYIALPASDIPGYLLTIDLFDRYKDVVFEQLPSEWDEEARIRFLRRARRGVA